MPKVCNLDDGVAPPSRALTPILIDGRLPDGTEAGYARDGADTNMQADWLGSATAVTLMTSTARTASSMVIVLLFTVLLSLTVKAHKNRSRPV